MPVKVDPTLNGVRTARPDVRQQQREVVLTAKKIQALLDGTAPAPPPSREWKDVTRVTSPLKRMMVFK